MGDVLAVTAGKVPACALWWGLGDSLRLGYPKDPRGLDVARQASEDSFIEKSARPGLSGFPVKPDAMLRRDDEPRAEPTSVSQNSKGILCENSRSASS